MNVKSGLFDGMAPWARLLLVAFVILVVLVLIGWGINIHDGTA